MNSVFCLVGKGNGKRSLARRRRREEGNIKVELRGTTYEEMDFSHLDQDGVQW
jgi:hypothetical protein